MDVGRERLTRDPLFDNLEVLAGFEAHCLPGRDADLGSGARVAANACLAGLHREDAEAAQFDAVACSEALLHRFEDRIDGSLCLGADEAGAIDDTLDKILFNQQLPRGLQVR
jgi:hypothetical protein